MLALVLAALLAVAMLPAAGLQAAYADEPVERPATSGGDVALQSANGDVEATAAVAPAAEEREGGMLVADGLLYTVADGGLALVGFDEGASLRGALSVPAAVSVDGRDVPVVAIDMAEGSVAEGVTALSIPQSAKDIRVGTLAPAFPGLLSVEVASGQGSTLPAAAGAAAMRATYSSFGGALLGQATVDVEGEGGTTEPAQRRELLWVPPAAVAVRLPVDCLSVAPGALVDASGLETIVCFGDVQRIATAERDAAGSVTVPGALTDDQLASVTVVFPDATPAVPSEGDGRVSASMALNDGATQTDKRHAWVALGLPLERLSMGKPVGALTETVAVTEEGAPAAGEAQLISYPGMHPKATDVKHPGEDGKVDMADNGLAYEMKSDMTLSVHWEGDPTATPSHLEIPAYVTIDNVTYPVTEIAPNAFRGAVFLTSVVIPETVTTITKSAFADCVNLSETSLPSMGGVIGDADPAASPSAEAVQVHEGFSMSSEGGAEASDCDIESQVDVADDFVVPYLTAQHTARVQMNTNAGGTMSLSGTPTNMTISASGDRYLGISYTGSESTINWTAINWGDRLDISCVSSSQAAVGGISLLPPSGWGIVSVGVDNPGVGLEGTHLQAVITVGLIPWKNMVNTTLLTSEAAASLYAERSTIGTNGALSTSGYSTVDAGLKSLKDAVNAKASSSTVTSLTNVVNGKLDSSAISSYNTNAKLDAKFNTKVDASDFGTITYSGLDEGDASVYPTSYRKGGTPALPTPKRDGFEFAGWSWARGDASGDSSNIASAFSDAGTVALAANWEEAAPEANCFFADAALDSATGGAWESVIAVKLTADTSKTSVSGIVFRPNDLTGLLKARADGSLPDVTFAVGSSRGGVSGSYGFDDAPTGSVSLADVGGGKGIYVKIAIPAGGIDTNHVVASQTAEDYIASLARMTYTSIA